MMSNGRPHRPQRNLRCVSQVNPPPHFGQCVVSVMSEEIAGSSPKCESVFTAATSSSELFQCSSPSCPVLPPAECARPARQPHLVDNTRRRRAPSDGALRRIWLSPAQRSGLSFGNPAGQACPLRRCEAAAEVPPVFIGGIRRAQITTSNARRFDRAVAIDPALDSTFIGC